MIELRLPWPDPKLSPNKRIDRRGLIRVRQTAREIGFYAVKSTGEYVRAVPLEVELCFFPPDERKRDLDNLFASMKSYLDGIFEALELDDALIERVVLKREEFPGEPGDGGEVIVNITEIGG